MQKYNESAKPAQQLRDGDFIMKVNGMKDSASKMVKELKAATNLVIVVRRSELFEIEFEKNGSLRCSLLRGASEGSSATRPLFPRMSPLA